tara:strand:+ start:190 stop:897 length:708 start_codon:yes stop_codon:yes gene_type:complete
MSDRKNPPKAIDIVEYWDKQPLIELKDRHWNPMVDVGEPSCQACGCWNPEWDIGEFTGSYEQDKPLINERWEISGLEKAHIVPHSLGGANLPSNFLMLCRSCHFDFDSEIVTTSRKDIYTWLQERPTKKSKRVEQIIRKVCKENKISKDELCRASSLIRYVDKIFDENQKVQLESKEQERHEKYNYIAKNLQEQTEITLDKFIAVGKIARGDQKRLDLGLSEWYNYIKELGFTNG